MIISSQKFWVVYVRYRFIPEQCVRHIVCLLAMAIDLKKFEGPWARAAPASPLSSSSVHRSVY